MALNRSSRPGRHRFFLIFPALRTGLLSQRPFRDGAFLAFISKKSHWATTQISHTDRSKMTTTRQAKSPISYLLSPVSYLLSPGSWLLAPGSWLLAPVS
jgi:hypothetical protein